MNKLGHLTATGLLAQELPRRYRFFLKLGSLLPDLLVFTYVGGHNWDSTREKPARRMLRPEETGRESCASYLRLGYILHYVQDYFTYPHNSWYPGSMAEHGIYELSLTAYARRQETAPQSIRPARSAQALMDCLTQTHREYARQTPGVGTDFTYLMSAAEQVLSYYAQVFQQNEAEFTLVLHPAEKLN